MLSYLLPIRWQCHAVISDHTVSKLSPTTPNHTCNYNINILVGLGQRFIQQRWSENPKLARNIPFIQTMQLINYKILVTKPHLGISMFVLNDTVHSYQTRHRDDFHIALANTTCAQNCIRQYVPRLLTSMPVLIISKVNTHSYIGFSNYVNLF